MTAIRYVDNGVMCNHEGCSELTYGSQLGLGDEPSLTMVRDGLAQRGWKTAVRNIEYANEFEIRHGPLLDYCPKHAEEAKGHE